mgnify:CR=1 FL=1
MSKFNFKTKLKKSTGSSSRDNEILIKNFIRKFKKSGIVKELKKKQYPISKGQKKRLKKYLGKKRQQRNKLKSRV